MIFCIYTCTCEVIHFQTIAEIIPDSSVWASFKQIVEKKSSSKALHLITVKRKSKHKNFNSIESGTMIISTGGYRKLKCRGS